MAIAPPVSPRDPFDPARYDRRNLTSLGVHSDRPEVQGLLRDAIRRGEIRVRTEPGRPGHVRVIPPAGGPG